MSIKNHLVGDTIQITWVSSGVTPSDIYAAVFDGSETLVNSITMSSSGNGHYYADYTISDSAGYYVAETLATVNSLPYKRRSKFKAIKSEVD